jgi:hypothetical protein
MVTKLGGKNFTRVSSSSEVCMLSLEWEGSLSDHSTAFCSNPFYFWNRFSEMSLFGCDNGQEGCFFQCP